MKRSIKKLALVSVLCVMPLAMGGCCDKCVKGVLSQMWGLYTSFARMKAECCQTSTTNAEYLACTEQVRVAEIQAATAISTALGACQMEEYDRAKQIMEDFLDTIDRLFPSLFPIGPTPNTVEQAQGGVYRNSLTLFMPSDGVEFQMTATTDGILKKRDTILIDGHELLPEAAGKAAVKSGNGNPEGQPSTVVLRRETATAMEFRTFVIDPNSSVNTQTMLGDVDFEAAGEFELSQLMFADDNTSEAIPREAQFVITTAIGSLYFTLDPTNPSNRLALDADGKGVLRGEYMVKGTDRLDIASEVISSIWLEIPMVYDFATSEIDTGFLGEVKAGSVAPDSTVEDDGNKYNLPGTITVGCTADGIGLQTGVCTCVDTDGDGLPDSYSFEQLMRNTYQQHVNHNWCD